MKVGIIDYGFGNIGSVRRALTELGADSVEMTDPADLTTVERIVLPGVGSFADAMTNIVERGWKDEIKRHVIEQGKPILGICLGMQLLASFGNEHGQTAGLDLIPGEIVELGSINCELRVPHVGWNQIVSCANHPLFSSIPVGTDFYFVHSFTFKPIQLSDAIAFTEYGVPVVAAVGRGNVMGTQYHPEKSAKAGFQQLKNFLAFKSC